MTIETVRQERQIEFVAKENGQAVGRIFLMTPAHLEGPEVEKEWRGSWAFKRLVDAAEKEAKAMGLTTLLAFGVNTTMENYILRLGYKQQPWTVWKKELPCRSEQ